MSDSQQPHGLQPTRLLHPWDFPGRSTGVGCHCLLQVNDCCCCCCCVTSFVSDPVRPHRWQPTRLPHPWDSPGKNTGVGCHFLLQCMKVESGKWKVKVKSLSCVRPFETPWTVARQAPPSMGFSRQEYWSGMRDVISFSRGYSQPRDQAQVSCTAVNSLITEPPRITIYAYI